MEIACISNHIMDEAQVLRLLQICIKGDAHKWLNNFEAQHGRDQPGVPITVDIVKDALSHRYRTVEDADKVWQEIKVLKQDERETVEAFEKRFIDIWDKLCRALGVDQPLAIMKKDNFIEGLKLGLRWKVELKKPLTYDEAVHVAK